VHLGAADCHHTLKQPAAWRLLAAAASCCHAMVAATVRMEKQ